MTPTKCKNCERPATNSGFCGTHYTKFWRQKNPKKAKETQARNYQKFKSTEKYLLWRKRDKKIQKLKCAKLRLERLKRDYPELF
jgi:hypothetical protein